MGRPRIIDGFPFNNELDMLEMRLTELYDAVDCFLLCEAPVDHQDHAKPFHFAENRERFAPWADKIVHVMLDREDMPTVEQNPDPWGREHAQREGFRYGLARIADLKDEDIFIQSDVDEIPRALHARNVRPRPKEMLTFGMRMHCFAIDWLYPSVWNGSVAARVDTLLRLPEGARFTLQRDNRLRAPCPDYLEDAGWHFSWLGGREAAFAKLNSFCHPEIAERTEAWLREERYWSDGYHVDGVKQTPVDVDDTYPRWIREGHAPASWYRPR